MLKKLLEQHEAVEKHGYAVAMANVLGELIEKDDCRRLL